MSIAKTNMDKKLLEDQLSDLMSMVDIKQICDGGFMRIIQIESAEHHADGAQVVQIISLLERLLKTKPIWFLPQVTRE